MANARKRVSTSTRKAMASPRLVGIVDEADAEAFQKASRKLILKVGNSKKRAIEVLKASGYLTASGKVAKPYR